MQGMSYEINNKNPDDRKRFIKNIFDSIVPTYDLLNHMLSLGIDILWRKRIFRLMRSVKDELVLDLCCGTGDISKLLAGHGALTVSLDFSLEMLKRGISRNSITGMPVAADASILPFAENIFSAETIAFGIRNIPDLDNFISEAYRVLSDKGELAILELVRPHNSFVKLFYSLYLHIILPLIGGIVSGKFTAYKYLSKTIATFVDPEDLKKLLEKYGFRDVSINYQTFGIAAIIIAKK